MSKIEKAISWMETMARDDNHGYDQIYRWGEKGDYDCSAAVITAWEQAGVHLKSKGATYTGNMPEALIACGFKDVTGSVNLATGAGIRRGDVQLNRRYHVAMNCGNGLEVEASINEKGTATGGTPGDQTGREFLIRPYRNYPWNYIFRYAGDGSTAAPELKSVNSTVQSNTGEDCMRLSITDAGDGYFYIKDKAHGLYLDVAGGASENGTNVQFYKGNKSDAQKWKLIGKKFKQARYLMLSPKCAPDKFLSVENNGADGKNNLKLWSDLHNQKQKFYAREEPDGYTLLIHAFSGKCVSAKN